MVDQPPDRKRDGKRALLSNHIDGGKLLSGWDRPMRSLHPRASRLACALLLTIWLSPAALAQNGVPASTANGPAVSFPPSTQPLPTPFLSASGRFSSLDPPNKQACHNSSVTGRVVSPRLIRTGHFVCGNFTNILKGFPMDNSLMNIEFSDPADAAKMVTGKDVTITGIFMDASEMHGSYPVNYLIAKNVRILASDQAGTPVQASSSFMMCQPPELDVLASKLGRELCVQSTLVANLSVTGPALEAAARAPLSGPPRDAASGDPTTITCRADPEHSDAHLIAIACARNNYWAWWVGKQQNPVGYGIPAPP
jgi:hypothetical protein